MLVYLAHLQISNEVRSHTYRTHTVHLELRSGRKRRAVVSANADLSRIGLLHIHRGHIVGTLGFDINAYTLCTTCIRSGGVVHQVTNPSRISDIRPFASCALGAPASPTEPASPRIRSEQQKTIKRVLAPDGERKLLGEIAAIVGPTDMQKNGGNWRNRIRHSALYRKALRHAVEDWKVRTPDQRSAIRNPAAWLTDRFMRAIVEIEKAQPPASAS